MTSHYMHIELGMMPFFNPIQDLDQSDTYTKKNEIQWNQFKLLSRHQALMTEHPGALKKFGKNKNIEIPRTYIMCLHEVTLNI